MVEASAISSAQGSMDFTHVDRHHGLEWVEEIFCLVPRWTLEPCTANIETLSRQHLALPVDASCSVSFFNQGAFNRLYKIETSADTYLMRVALPVDPYLKIASEVATMEYVREHTNVVLPLVKAYDFNNQNILGFAWILMEFGPPHTLNSLWRSLTMSEKYGIIESLAEVQAELFDCSYQGIGNLYWTSECPTDHRLSFELGPMVALTFFEGDRGRRQIARGPFCNSFHWLNTRLHSIGEEQSRILEVADDNKIVEDAKRSKSLAEQLHRILPSLLDRDGDPERSIIFHDDLHDDNIVVGNDSKQLFIIDWECVSTLPLWRACQFPKLLMGRMRTEEPKVEDYGSSEDWYWRDLLKYERWKLRDTFEAKMKRLRPQWIEEHRKGALKRDFERAVDNYDDAYYFHCIKQWLDAYYDGKPVSLEKLFYE